MHKRFNRYCKQPNAWSSLESLQSVLYHFLASRSVPHLVPEPAPRIHGAGVKLDIVRITEAERLDTGVCGPDLMVQAALENRDATKHEVPFRRAFY